MRGSIINRVRRFQTVISITLFFIVFMICWATTGFHLAEIQLSVFGESGLISYLWNGAVCLLSVSVFINSILYIRKNRRLKWKWISYLMFTFISICLFFTGYFNLNWGDLHNWSAWIYFFCYPLFIFLHTHINRKESTYKDWLFGTVLSVAMMIFPAISVSLFSGLAIPETIHIFFVIIWNLKIAFK